MGDRGGGRESKGTSLKKSKKNPGSTVAKQKKVSLKAQGIHNGPQTSLPPPALTFAKDTNKVHFDCGIALLSRQFDRDRDRVIQRAHEDGHCVGCLTWYGDVEKQLLLADYCKTQSGFCYCAIGIHPDNIDRSNKKVHSDWVEKVEELGRRAECIALLSGLNLSREVRTHFSQEAILKSVVQVAQKIKLPLMMHVADGKSLERFIDLLSSELLNDEPNADTTFILHDIMIITGGDNSYLPALLAKKEYLYFSISAAGIADAATLADKEKVDSLRTFFTSLPIDRLLLCSDSPWKTPQNLADPYLRTLRNEPSNVIGIIDALAEIIGQPAGEIAVTLKENALRVFSLDYIELSPQQLQKSMEKLKVNDSNANDGNEDDECDENDDDENHSDDEDASNQKKSQVTTKSEKQSDEVTVADDNTTTSNAMKEVSQAQYKCVKCRTVVFSQENIRNHEVNAAKTVFKVGQEGLCNAFLFIDASDGREHIHTKLGVTIRGSSIECLHCGYKLGKYSPIEGICACGAIIQGAVGKVNANKVDYHDPNVILQEEGIKELAEKAKQELDDNKEDEDDDVHDKKQGRVKKTKKHKSENRGNFSSFRNKTFVPNASRNKKNVNENDEEGDSDN